MLRKIRRKEREKCQFVTEMVKFFEERFATRKYFRLVTRRGKFYDQETPQRHAGEMFPLLAGWVFIRFETFLWINKH